MYTTKLTRVCRIYWPFKIYLIYILDIFACVYCAPSCAWLLLTIKPKEIHAKWDGINYENVWRDSRILQGRQNFSKNIKLNSHSSVFENKRKQMFLCLFVPYLSSAPFRACFQGRWYFLLVCFHKDVSYLYRLFAHISKNYFKTTIEQRTLDR